MILEKIFEPAYEEKELFKITVKKEWQISTARRNLNQLAKAKGFQYQPDCRIGHFYIRIGL